MESEFFGHKKGSFTGAVADQPGLFQAAHGGTLFLDEVAELPIPMQVKLLRAIQEKCVRPIGAQQEVPVDVRILSATHKDLGPLATDGRFRQDLYYRINVIALNVSALRAGRGDIPEPVEHDFPGIGGLAFGYRMLAFASPESLDSHPELQLGPAQTPSSRPGADQPITGQPVRRNSTLSVPVAKPG